MGYIEYHVTQVDTLEAISAKFLGTPSRWREIATLNRLRYPFISDDPLQQYGQPITSGALTTAITANSLTYSFLASELPVSSTIYSANCVFFVQSGVTYDAMALSVAVSESTGLLTFSPSVALTLTKAVALTALTQEIEVNNLTGVVPGIKMQIDSETITVSQIASPDADVPTITAVFTASHAAGAAASYGFQNAYPVGTPFTLFGPQRDNRLRVLRTGDIVRVPSPGASSNIAQTGDAVFANLLGTDILVDQTGMILFGVNGDTQRVRGTKNLAQALRLRLSTALNSYVRHADYGNAMFDFVGQTTDPYFATLVEGLVRQALLADARVGAVPSVKVTISGATIKVDATVQVIQSASLLRLDNLILVGR